MRHILKYSLLSAAIFTAYTQAEEFRQHDAHVHGEVEFNIAQDSNELLVEIMAPGADVVGFEHAPENKQQLQLIEQAEKRLKQAENIVALSAAAKCKAEHIHVANTLEGDSEHDHHDDHKHDGHDHHKHEEGGHGEFSIEYHFECDNISKLQSIETNWFNHFPKTEKINVNLLTETVQKTLQLTAGNTTIKL